MIKFIIEQKLSEESLEIGDVVKKKKPNDVETFDYRACPGIPSSRDTFINDIGLVAPNAFTNIQKEQNPLFSFFNSSFICKYNASIFEARR